MGYTAIEVSDLQAAPGPHPAASPFDKGVGAELGVTAFGLYQVELPPGASSVEHDHAADRVEDVYAFLRGSGAVVVDGQDVPVRAGAFVAVSAESSRCVRAGREGLVYIAVCAAPS